jgi:acyl-coenzyme A synthetase/AMP-(fatty) acid ligase
MNSLRAVIFAGEPLAAQYLAEWMEAFPQIAFYNGYGPTEATGVSLCYHVPNVPKPGQKIPIGKPCKGAKAIILGDDGFPVPKGEIGELCISGDGLAKGYLNDQEKTDRQFSVPPPGLDLGARIYYTGDLVQTTPAGDYVFISRKDQQIKWMGYRIELGEIETNLIAHPDIEDAVVLLVETNDGTLSTLAAFFESNDLIPAQSLAQHLSRLLPQYMIPKKFIQIEELPRNDRGKISRRDLLDWYQMKEKLEDAEKHG